MSGTAPEVPPITMPERAAVRRFTGRAARGYGATTDPFGRWFSDDPTFDWRLSNLSVDELPILRVMLADLERLDRAIVSAGDGLDTASAAVWTRNPREMQERAALYAVRRRTLCDFLGVAPGEGLRAPGVRLVI